MDLHEKIQTISRNFSRLCEASKLETAFITFCIEDYHGSMLYQKNREDSCKVMISLHKAVEKTLLDIASGKIIGRDINLN